ncbi:hypothetical protein D3C80_1763110 [compost metagenome]
MNPIKIPFTDCKRDFFIYLSVLSLLTKIPIDENTKNNSYDGCNRICSPVCISPKEIYPTGESRRGKENSAKCYHGNGYRNWRTEDCDRFNNGL